MSNPIQLKTPADQLLYEFDWYNELTTGVTLQTVVHSAPVPLIVLGQQLDAPNARSFVTIAGGAHGNIYIVSALATLSDGEQVSGEFTLRVVQPPN